MTRHDKRSTPALPTYDARQLTGLLAILPDIDTVELKLTIPEESQRSVTEALDIDPLDATIRQVAYFDTPDLRLSAAGVVVRARRTQRRPADLTVKLRPMLPDAAPVDLRDHDGFKVEVDASPAGYVCSCSLTTELADGKGRKLLAGSRPLDGLLDHAQRGLLRDRLPDGVGLEHLIALGPVHLLKTKFRPDGLRRPMVAELWMLPDGTRILELSTKASAPAAFQAAAETKVFLATRGIDLSAPQEAKTSVALATLTRGRNEGGP